MTLIRDDAEERLARIEHTLEELRTQVDEFMRLNRDAVQDSRKSVAESRKAREVRSRRKPTT